MSVQVSYKKQFIFGIILLLVIFSAIEIIVRTVEIVDPYFTMGEGIAQRECLVLSSEVFEKLSFEEKTTICDDHSKLEYKEEMITTIVPNQHYSTININDFGMRGNEITKVKQEGIFRIFLAGSGPQSQPW